MGGDNSNNKAETLRLITDVLPKRLKQMGDEIQWSLDRSMPQGFVMPPDWVRRLIHQILGFDGDPPEKLTSEDLAAFFGMLGGLGQGAQAMLAEASNEKLPYTQSQQAYEEFCIKLSASLQPSIQNAEKIVEKIRPALNSNTKNLAAYSEMHSESVGFVAQNIDGDGTTFSTTEELQFFLWTAWPQVESAGSVRALHSWISDLGLLHCSLKLLEKIAAQIGLRLSSRGKKKRIPTKDGS